MAIAETCGTNSWKQNFKEFLIEYSIDISILPPSHIFFISIEDYDRLIAVLKHSKATLYEVLANAVNDNAEMQSKKLTFGSHLSAYDDNQLLDLLYITEPYLELCCHVQKKFSS